MTDLFYSLLKVLISLAIVVVLILLLFILLIGVCYAQEKIPPNIELKVGTGQLDTSIRLLILLEFATTGHFFLAILKEFLFGFFSS